MDKLNPQERPSVLFRPRLKSSEWDCQSRKWEAFYGDPNNYYAGVRAWGATPEEAMLAFDLAFKTGREITYLYDIENHERRKAETEATAAKDTEAAGGTSIGSPARGGTPADPLST